MSKASGNGEGDVAEQTSVLARRARGIRDEITYDGFGHITNETNPAYGGRYKFTGREFDVETGLQYNRARYYDATTGRWNWSEKRRVAGSFRYRRS